MNYDLDYFITKFTAIPDEFWCTGEYISKDNSERRCALGHCGEDEYDGPTEESLTLYELVHKNLNIHISELNDYSCDDYPQPTPKGRVLAALHKIPRSNYLL